MCTPVRTRTITRLVSGQHMCTPAEHACDVLGGLTLANLDGVGPQVDGVPSQLEEPLHVHRPHSQNNDRVIMTPSER